MCCGVVPILFGWFLSVSSLHVLFSFGKLFCDLLYLVPALSGSDGSLPLNNEQGHALEGP